jgi:hypothetical protein
MRHMKVRTSHPSHAPRPFRECPVSGRKSPNSGRFAETLSRGDPKTRHFPRFDALTGPQSPVAIFECPEFSGG